MQILKLVLSILLTFIFSSCIKGKKVEYIFHNAKIHSCDEENHLFEAMAISKGKIVELGPERQILNKYRFEESVDLERKHIYPTLSDANFKLFDVLEKRISIETKDIKNLNHFIYLVEKKLELVNTPIIYVNSKKISKEDIIKVLIKKFQKNSFIIKTNNEFIKVYNSNIESYNNLQQTNYKSTLWSSNFTLFKQLYIEIQNELIEHGFNDIIIHNCNKEQLDFLKKIDSFITINIYIYANHLVSQKSYKKLKIHGYYLDTTNKNLITKIIQSGKPISFTSSFFSQNITLFKKTIPAINQDHRWICILNSHLNKENLEYINEFNIYPVINSNSIEKTNFLSCYGSNSTQPFEMELDFINKSNIDTKQMYKSLFSNTQKLIYQENTQGELKKEKTANFIILNEVVEKISYQDQLYINRFYHKNKLIYQID